MCVGVLKVLLLMVIKEYVIWGGYFCLDVIKVSYGMYWERVFV